MKQKNCSIRMIVVVLSLIMLTSLPASFFSVKEAEASKKEDVVTVTFWKAPLSEREAELWAGYIADFEAENPGIKIKHEIVPWDTWSEKYTSGFASDRPPDVSYMVDWWSAKFAFASQFIDLDTEGYSAEVKDDYDENIWSIAHINGHQYGVISICAPRLIFYNKDIFDAAGVDYPSPDWTWNDFMKTARKLTTDDYYGWVEPMTYAGRAFQTYFKWLWNAGGSMFNEDYSKALVNSPEAVEALEFVINMFNEGIVPPFGQYDNVSQEDLFMRGGVAMGELRQLAVAQMRSDFPDLNFGVVVSPKGPAGTQYSYADWGYYAISDRCPHKDEAWKWVKYITSKEIAADYLNAVTLMPAMKDTGLFADDPILSYFVANIDKNKNQPIHPQSLEILQLWWAEVELAVQGKKSAKAASDAAAKAINDLLSK